MSQFLADVRVFDVLAESGTGLTAKPSGSSSPDRDAAAVIESPTPTSSPKHHSDNNDGVFAAIPITAIVFTFIYLIIKAIMAPFTNRAKYAASHPAGSGGLTQEEIAVLQKLQRTLSQMESRVEALETILIEQARTEKKYGSKL